MGRSAVAAGGGEDGRASSVESAESVCLCYLRLEYVSRPGPPPASARACSVVQCVVPRRSSVKQTYHLCRPVRSVRNIHHFMGYLTPINFYIFGGGG